MRVTTIALAVVLTTSAAYAQTTPPASSTPGNKAINTPDTPNAPAPVAGANSFTEAQAKSRIENNGFSAVTNLKKDEAGVWRGTATKNGKTEPVSVDFQGNVVSQ